MLGLKMMSFVLPSFLSIPAFSPMGLYVIGVLVALVLAMVLTLIFGYEDKNQKNSSKAMKELGLTSVKKETIASPLSGVYCSVK